MKIVDSLTNPEDSAERKQRRQVLETIRKHGGCALCTNRDLDSLAWGRYTCKALGPRTFPQCTSDERAPTFQLDEKQLKERCL